MNRLSQQGGDHAAGIRLHSGQQADGTLYTGSTNNLFGRIQAHREGKGCAFTAKYNVTMLVWYEEHELVTAAIQRETNIKQWRRSWKLALIEKDNPCWKDLFLDMM